MAALGIEAGCQQERGEPHLRRARRGRGRLPGAAPRPRPLPVPVPRRHLRQGPPGRLGRVQGDRGRHRGDRARRPGGARPRGRRLRGRRLLDRASCARCGRAAWRACGSSSATPTRASRAPSRAVLLGAAWQRCRVHFLRNVLARVPKGSAEMVLAAIRTIFAQPDAAAVPGAARRDRGQARAPLPGGRADARRRPRGPARLRRLPGRPLAEDLVDQPARAGQQGDQAPHRRGRHLPQRGGRSSASRARCCSRSTTSGRSPSAATSPRARWRSLTGATMMEATQEVEEAKSLLLAS